jgi:hypothetical protein
MRLARVLALGGIAWMALAAASFAQTAPVRSASIHGFVREASGQVVRRALLCAFGEAPRTIQCVYADTMGRFRLDSLYPGVHMLRAECETGRFTFDVRMLDTLRVVAEPYHTLTADFVVATTGCDQRPYEMKSGEMTGHWASGFELDDFVPCSDSTKHATVERRGLRPGELWHLPPGESVPNGQRWFVRWRGVWWGPRSVLTPYRMVVDEVFEMRLPRPTDCSS